MKPTTQRFVMLFLSTAFLAGDLGGLAAAADTVSVASVETVRQRYRQWVLAGPGVDYADRHVAQRYELLKRQARRTVGSLKKDIQFEPPAGLYVTVRSSATRTA